LYLAVIRQALLAKSNHANLIRALTIEISLSNGQATMSASLYASVLLVGVWFLYSKLWSSSFPSEVKFPHVRFDEDNSPARYKTESETILAKGYAQLSTQVSPVSTKIQTGRSSSF
jgi:hypothetical protein